MSSSASTTCPASHSRWSERRLTAELDAFTAHVELDLRPWEGMIPVELLGGVPFPPIGELPYLLTLGGYGFYWFRVTTPATEELTAP